MPAAMHDDRRTGMSKLDENIREIDAELSWKKNAIHPRLRAR